MMPARRVVYTNATDQYTTAATAFEPTSVGSDGTIYMQVVVPPPDPAPAILNRSAERRYQRTGKVDYKPQRLEPWQQRR